MILGNAPSSEEELEDPRFQKAYTLAQDLYGLVHCRYIQTKDGMNKIRDKFEAKEFGICPRV